MNAPISEIMTRQVVTVDAEAPLPDVYRIVKENAINHLPVLRDGRLAGIISRTDLERVSFVGDPNSENVVEAMWDFLRTENLMTRSIVTIGINDSVKDAAEIFGEGKIHALPVMEGGKVAGIVTTTDMIRYLLKLMD
jgi:predicted transcriptional regulator